MPQCNICTHPTHTLYDPEIKVTYDVCQACGFTYKRPEHHVEPQKEKSLYDNHQNTMENKGYVRMFEKFLSEGVTPFITRGEALDFGSGPGPVLYELLKMRGFDAHHYDPFYSPDQSVLNHRYDLVTSTEVFEHFADPTAEIKRLCSMVKTGGFLAVMTSLRGEDDDAFLSWWYRRDQTHVSFYTLDALTRLGHLGGFKRIHTNNKNIVTFTKE